MKRLNKVIGGYSVTVEIEDDINVFITKENLESFSSEIHLDGDIGRKYFFQNAKTFKRHHAIPLDSMKELNSEIIEIIRQLEKQEADIAAKISAMNETADAFHALGFSEVE